MPFSGGSAAELRQLGTNQSIFTGEPTWLRVATREADKLGADASLQTLQRDLVLLQEPGRIVVGIPCHLLLGGLNNLRRPGADLLECGPREPNDAGSEKAGSFSPTKKSQ